jgi:SAM-dependent methyltransferase
VSRATARDEAERAWLALGERPPAGPLGRLIRRALRFYVEDVAARERQLADATLKLIDTLSEDVDALGRAVDERLRRLEALDERVLRLERRPREAAVPATVAAQPRADTLPDYFAFETRMRGSTDDVRRRQRAYVDDFRGAAPVLDVGCGRGEFVSLLTAAGIAARGVDADADMVAFARGEGLDVEQADALAHLESLSDGSLGGVFAAQLVEHLPAAALVRLLGLVHEKLRPGGVLVTETINPLSPLALRNYFADLTHAQPLVPETLEQLARQAGFADVQLRFVNAPPADAHLELPDDPLLRRNAERVNEILFAPLDYALVARR